MRRLATVQHALVLEALKVQPLDRVERICRDLPGASHGDTQKIGAELLSISKQYYMDVREQAKTASMRL